MAKITPGPEEMAALCVTDFSTFVREAWPTVVPGDPFQDNWHIEAICEHLEWLEAGEFYNLLINVPPRHAKSNICGVLFPSWCWIRDPAMRTMGASYSETLSMRDSLAMRRLVESDWYQSRWPLKLADDQNVKSRWENDKSGWRMATSTRGSATGEGADLLIVDDPHNVSESESEAERKQVLDWFNITMPSRTGRGGRRKTVVVMQRIHELDLSSDIIAKGYVHLRLPQEFEPDRRSTTWRGWTDPRKEAGELLWPSRFSEDVIAKTQRPPHMTSYAYAAQMQQRPAPIEGGMFQRGWWRYYSRDAEAILTEARKQGNDCCASWDCTFKETGESFVVGQVWARLGVDFYLIWQVRARMSFTATKQAIKLLAAKYPSVIRKLVEDKANGTAAIDDLKISVPGLVAVEPRGGKESRANAMQGFVEGGNVYLPEQAPWVEDFVEEFRVFPNGANDDQVDAASQAIADMWARYKKSFPAVVTSWASTTARPRAEAYRDPRYSAEPVVGYSERGDMRPPVQHNVESVEHRATCRACRSQFAVL
jgi:predicted phage terminase large subunit-like protein